MAIPQPGFGQYENDAAVKLTELALEEDLEHGSDVTSTATIPVSAQGSVRIVSRDVGVIAGLPTIPHVLDIVDHALKYELLCSDGDPVQAETAVARVSGPVRALLTAERTILNFLTHLSGIASLTAQYVEAVSGSEAVVLDTRKTLPGWRRLAKYAVRCGGGANHRMGLFDGVLVKDNHIASWRERNPNGSLVEMMTDIREHLHTSLPIEVEVDTLEQLSDVLAARPDIVLLDNMSNAQLRDAITIRNELSSTTLLEASGGVSLDTIGAIAHTGIDRISVGAITHSATNFDLGFDWET